MNKKIDNVWSDKLITLSNKYKTLCKVFSTSIILYRNPFVKEFCENYLIGGFFIMENHTNLLKNFFGTNRKCKRNMFRIMGTLYRAVTKGRITWEQGLEKVNSLGGEVNE